MVSKMSSGSRASKSLLAANGLLLTVERGVLLIALLVLSFAVFAEAVLRYGFHLSPIGLEEGFLYVVAWIYLVGAGYCTYERGHIRSGMLDVIIKSQSIRKAIGLASSVLSLVVSIMFIYLSYNYCLFVNSMGARSVSLGWPRIWQVSSLLVGFALIFIYLILEVVEEFRGYKSKAHA